MDCSTKSKAREIPRTFDDEPLRSVVDYPEGLQGLSEADSRRVTSDNLACQFLLDEI